MPHCTVTSPAKPCLACTRTLSSFCCYTHGVVQLFTCTGDGMGVVSECADIWCGIYLSSASLPRHLHVYLRVKVWVWSVGDDIGHAIYFRVVFNTLDAVATVPYVKGWHLFGEILYSRMSALQWIVALLHISLCTCQHCAGWWVIHDMKPPPPSPAPTQSGPLSRARASKPCQRTRERTPSLCRPSRSASRRAASGIASRWCWPRLRGVSTPVTLNYNRVYM